MTKVSQQVFVGIHTEHGLRTIEFFPSSAAAMESLKSPASPIALDAEQGGAVGILRTHDTPRVVLDKLSELLRTVFPDGYNGFAGNSIEFDGVMKHLEGATQTRQGAVRPSGLTRLVPGAMPTFTPHPPVDDAGQKPQRSTI